MEKGSKQQTLRDIIRGMVLFLCLLPFTAFSQTPSLDSLAKIVKAGDYPAAIAGYQNLIANQPSFVDAHLGLALALTLSEDYEAGLAEYSRYIVETNASVEHLRAFTKCLLFNGRFQTAIGVATEILRQKPFDPDAEKYMVLADSMDKAFTSELSYDLLLLPFNTPENELAPTVYLSNLGLTKSLPDFGGVQPYSTEIHRRGDKYSFYKPSPVWLSKPATGFDQGAFSYDASTRSIAITRRQAISDLPRMWPDSAAPLKIVFYEVDPDRLWDKEKPFAQNSNNYSNAFPCFALNGKYLLFASDRPGGLGGFDLYICRRDGNGWSNAVNLGSAVNTSGNETYPFLHADGTLYYSTDAHKSSHDFDIFEASLINGNTIEQIFSEAGKVPFATGVAMEGPVNSASDDFAFVMEDNRRHGFFCSNRTGGVGGDDIYALTIRELETGECQPLQPDGLCFNFYDANNLASGPTYAYQYEWNFGDGTSAFSEKVTHCFEKPGTYNVSLSIKDPASGQTLTSVEGPVTALRTSQAKVEGPTRLKVGQSAQFDGADSYLRDRRIVKYQWDFGDGVLGDGKQANHKYNTPGKYTLRLKVGGLSADLQDFEAKCTTIEVEVTE